MNNRLTPDTLKNDIEKAETLNPPLDIMYFVTTAPRDVVIQNFCRSYQGKFPVEIYYWDVLERFLQLNPQIKELHYPQQMIVDVTQQFVNEFLSLCNKYYIYYSLHESDYITPYHDKVIENNEFFCIEVETLLTSDKSLNVRKDVLKNIELFKNHLKYMTSQAAKIGHSNGNGICIPSFPEDKRTKLENFFLDYRQELLEIYCKYKF